MFTIATAIIIVVFMAHIVILMVLSRCTTVKDGRLLSLIAHLNSTASRPNPRTVFMPSTAIQADKNPSP